MVRAIALSVYLFSLAPFLLFIYKVSGVVLFFLELEILTLKYNFQIC